MSKKVLLVFGTRPEAIKMAPVFFSLAGDPTINVSVCLTGQHRDLLQQVVDLFGIPVTYNLNIMKVGQDIVDIMTAVQVGLRDVLAVDKPDLVLVHGDTTTSMAAAVTCFALSIAVGHVEAGLRTNNLASPFPEEFNRRVSALAARFHFAPTELNRQNLLAEGHAEQHVHVTGNTVVDALRMMVDRFTKNPDIYEQIEADFASMIDGWPFTEQLVLVTSHRRENFGEGLRNICDAIKELANLSKDARFIYPVHPNPNVQVPVREYLGDCRNVHLIPPLSYEYFCFLLNRAHLILTDSGGVQEEAPSIGKPVLVMRDTTERPEAVSAGTVKLVGTSKDEIIKHTRLLLTNQDAYKLMATSGNPYGDGYAANKIASIIARHL